MTHAARPDPVRPTSPSSQSLAAVTAKEITIVAAPSRSKPSRITRFFAVSIRILGWSSVMSKLSRHMAFTARLMLPTQPAPAYAAGMIATVPTSRQLARVSVIT